ncbi:metallophosphoesterase [Mangrovimonas cancribranchiae]|uniref:Metallophosphoesterase n=1 Tax=Mangrovimonas cancribranchiae TaxID=3080055 RepID=A0AAU6P292_9FLAO
MTHLKLSRFLSLFLIAFLAISCATFKTQYKHIEEDYSLSNKPIAHTFYLIGDAGNSPIGTSTKALQHFKQTLETANKNSTALFLGDNIYPKGMPKKGKKGRDFAEHQLHVQTQAAKDFKGRAIFIPGNHDWYSGLNGLERQEDYIDDALGKNSFLPEHGCPLERETISDDIELIIVDSEWYLTNWNNHPTMNDECDIKTREVFWDEFESDVKKSRGKTTVIALHHPLFSFGPHNGKYSFQEHLKPVPGLGTLKNVLRKTTGVVPADIQFKRYNEFRKRMIRIAQENDRVIFVSGHEHSLQYIVQDNLPQIISGSGSKSTATKLEAGAQFTSSNNGFAKLLIYEDGSSAVEYVDSNTKESLFTTEIYTSKTLPQKTFKKHYNPTVTASVYTPEETEKSKFYRFLWGNRYRNAYSTPISTKTVMLDTLMGGLTPIRKGGGTQSNSLRLADSTGKEFVMRGLRKNAQNFIQSVAFKDQYVEGQFSNTYTEGLVFDVFTGSHPYAPFIIDNLSTPINVLHTNPKLYYVPKQETFLEYIDTFGDELYMIEEHAGDDHGHLKSFAYSDELIGTDDMFLEIRSDEDIIIDEAAFIRARLFDMLIGDWDRHADQWRWATTKADKKVVYQPVPRDRDQAFSKIGDGFLFSIGRILIPLARKFQTYDTQLKDIKWFNLTPYKLDVVLTSQSDSTIWEEQAKYIQTHLTDQVIDKAFEDFPEGVKNSTTNTIKQQLKERRSHLLKMAKDYYNIVSKTVVVQGTDKDDWFDIERLPNGQTKIIGYRIKKGKKADVFFKRTFTLSETKAIWLYALDDDDVLHVHGNSNKYIAMYLIGGQNNDIYTIENGKKVFVYDFKSKPNTFKTTKGRVTLTDDYDINIYDYEKPSFNAFAVAPILGYNPDDGVKLGLSGTYTVNGFKRNPFTEQHKLSAAYYFATQGFDMEYEGEFAQVINDFNLGLNARLTSPNYSINFFGFGNETINPNYINDHIYDLDYNRVKLSAFKIAPSLIKRGDLGSKTSLKLLYETIEVEQIQHRFINTYYNNTLIENRNHYAGLELSYAFQNKDYTAFPTLGMSFGITTGYKTNIDNHKDFGYIIPDMSIDYKLISNGKLVLASKLKGHFTIGNEFEFFQAASIGASNGLRGYRNERFTGKNAFYQLTDIRYLFDKMRTGLLPINVALYGGFDYGRVWLENDFSNTWHTSYGGGIMIIGAEMLTANISLFNSNENPRFAFGLGVLF